MPNKKCSGSSPSIRAGALSVKGKRKGAVRQWTFVRTLIAVIVLIYTVFPIYWLLSISLRSDTEMQTGLTLFQNSFTLSHYVSLFEKSNFGAAIVNSLEVTGISLLCAIAFGLCCAYVIARNRFRFGFKKPLTFWTLLVRMLPPVAYTIPLYIMFSKLGVLGTKLPIIMACVFIDVPLIVWFMISFYQEMPAEMEESAKIDGATELQLFLRIVIPLVAPAIAAIAMLSFMYAWNEYTYSVIFVQTSTNFTVPLALAVLNTEDNLMQFGRVAAGGILSVLPSALFVIFAQNYLITGLSNGAVKG